jgi:hypothetical protein
MITSKRLRLNEPSKQIIANVVQKSIRVTLKVKR